MPTEIGPKKIQKAVEDGLKRLETFRSSRLMFLRQFVGQYYGADHGQIGSEPLNLIFNAIRVLVPNLIFNFPVHKVGTRFLAHRQYGEMLGQALSQQDKQLNIREVYKRWIIDAIFLIGIVKTGLCDSGTAIGMNEDDRIDPGTVYTENVDFDNFVFDPNARRLEEAMFVGDRISVSRQSLLDSGLYNNDLIERLPKAGGEQWDRDRAEKLSAGDVNFQETGDLDEHVEIFELWVPRAKAIITVPATTGFTLDDFLRVHDAYGPDDGPYTYMRLTPPVPNNPIPISMVGIWHDLHIMANRMAKKIMDQADRQKDIIGYKRQAADDAQEALEATDGEAIAMDDPDGVKTFSFGGQQPSNDAAVQRLQMWFNMMAGNPEGLAGMSMNAKTASEANILQSNAQISLEDMKDIVYVAVGAEGRKRAWFMHTDPLIEVPLIRRVHNPVQMQIGPDGMPSMSSPEQPQEVQVFLTPEARCGDFLDFTFDIEPESMGRMDSQKRIAQAMEFAAKILPAAAQAAQLCMQMGVPFSFPRFATKMAQELGIKWMDEVFLDPEFQQRMAMMMMRGPQEDQSKGSMAPGGGMAGIMQNGQPPSVGATMNPMQQQRSAAQAGAADGQADLPVRSSY